MNYVKAILNNLCVTLWQNVWKNEGILFKAGFTVLKPMIDLSNSTIKLQLFSADVQLFIRQSDLLC